MTATIGRLHRVGLRRAESVRMQLDADEAVIDALPAPLLLMDAERQVVRANRTARELFGDKVVDRDLASSLRTPTVLEAVDSVLRGVRRASSNSRCRCRWSAASRRRSSPSSGWCRNPTPPCWTERSRRDPAPRPPTVARMAILTLHDVTAARRSEQMRADFIANASHELRTPLSSLLGFIETLRGPARDDPEAQDRFLSIMHDQASRMTRLVNDLLSLSRHRNWTSICRPTAGSMWWRSWRTSSPRWS
ncbi:histidine kinase dimerization/phospho-acceptor domain-containing protein [Azospirillum sp. INR13]|uniref:histidine kinase dimerization/phospho-acceptor domain-containing protein n=1 Tax=Azospirillum sp. INR13 TaxID=2596919 RepID=UPI002107A04F|nr:histidine kinase dimerization/phospho-acceptor domain-containing protein [Azospirillum sp. INR13]